MSRRKPYALEMPETPTHWRSLEDKHASKEDRKALAEAELPGGFTKGLIGSGSLFKKVGREDPIAKQPKLSRRGFLATGSAATAALTLQGCIRRPVENIVPYVQAPEYLIPGSPLHFATVTQRGNDAMGLLVTSHTGRPTKVEGNADQSSSTGGTDGRAQAEIWNLYDPDRSRGPQHGEESATFAEFDAMFRELLDRYRSSQGRGLRILMQPTNSPSVLRLRGKIQQDLPLAKFHVWSSVGDDEIRDGARLAFGQVVYPVYSLERADTILALDSDFLGEESGAVRHGKAWGARRGITDPDRDAMNRLYVVEGTYSLTGGAADHRLRVPAQACDGFLRALAKAMEGRNRFTLGALAASVQDADGGEYAEFIDALADDLTGVQGRTNRAQRGGVIVVGPRQPAHVHALAYAMNHALGSIGRRETIGLYRPSDPEQPNLGESLKTLVAEADEVETLLILGGNPVYDAPGDIDVSAMLDREGLTSIHLGYSLNETSKACSWHVPLAHELETWGDQRSADGTLSIQQPLIAPLFGGRSPLEMLALVAGERNWRGHYVTRKTLRARIPSAVTFERQWRRALHRGVIAGTSEPVVSAAPQAAAIAAALRENEPLPAPTSSSLEVQFLPDPLLFDGRNANNLWALECPDPVTKIVWDNAALISRATRDELGLRNGDVVRLSKEGLGDIEVPVWTVPGHADNSLTLLLGWGRTAAGRYGTAQTWPGLGPEPDWRAGGFDVNPLRSVDARGFMAGVTLTKTPDTYDIVQTQTHGYMEGRPVAIEATLEEYQERPDFASYETVELISGPLWDRVDYSPREVATGRTLKKWGMVIDLSSCTGCNACIIACQAENNIPSVGKQEVKRGREMLWMRLDRYWTGDEDNPSMAIQPVSCQQCEQAPCENVCPVNATAHSPEGLNDMAYNRCIGTRYCANNCPYKVRRFNYLDWHNHLDDPWAFHGEFSEMRQMQFNPNVTVRMRGVMEKCTYCVQKIQEAKFVARRERRDLRDGDIKSACGAVCSSGSIVFGDLNDSSSRVARAAATNREYKLLAEVGAQPRTSYLARISNPNPRLHTTSPDEEAHG
ncbi:MAG: 4Fe-4S dicluster domain-containing protein [Myxococcota bacterium]